VAIQPQTLVYADTLRPITMAFKLATCLMPPMSKVAALLAAFAQRH
jgi:hypothetical protein